MKFATILTATAISLSAMSAHAQIIVSATDGKRTVGSEGPETRTPDNVTVIDLSGAKPRVVGSVSAAASVIGPPTTIALAPNSKLALVTAPQKLDPAARGGLADDDTLSVIDLSKPATPQVVQTLHLGGLVGGVAISNDGKLALAAVTGKGSIAVFKIDGMTVTAAGEVQLPAGSKPMDVDIAADGKSALVASQGDNKIVRLSISGADVKLADGSFTVGSQPFNLEINPAGTYAYVTTTGGRLPTGGATQAPPGSGVLAVLDLKAGTVGQVIDSGPTPEYVNISPDGKFLELTLGNGANGSPNSPSYHPNGILRVYKIDGATLTQVAEAPTAAWCQGAVWTSNSKRILLQCAMSKQIEVYDFDGKALTRDQASTLEFAGRPVAIGGAGSR